MHQIYRYTFLIIWIAYFVYWWSISKNVKDSVKTEAALSRIIRAISIILALLLLWFSNLPLAILNVRFLPSSKLFFWIGLVITVCGLCFSVWARLSLGKNWSQSVTIKNEHQLITTGPYLFVRHPIYTGLIFGFIGTSIAVRELRGLIADILVLTVLVYKLKLEDKWLTQQFGESYKEYSRKVNALIPFIF